MNLTTEKKLNRLRILSQLLDSQIKGPFGIRFGLDGIIGLVPGIGDLITTLISCYIIFGAYQLGVGPIVLARMILNQGIDSLIGVIPIFGDLFDIAWKSNIKNVNLLEKFLQNPTHVERHSWVLFAGLMLGIGLLVFAVIYAMVILLRMIF